MILGFPVITRFLLCSLPVAEVTEFLLGSLPVGGDGTSAGFSAGCGGDGISAGFSAVAGLILVTTAASFKFFVFIALGPGFSFLLHLLIGFSPSPFGLLLFSLHCFIRSLCSF